MHRPQTNITFPLRTETRLCDCPEGSHPLSAVLVFVPKLSGFFRSIPLAVYLLSFTFF
jgi:hypothetical protein